MSSQIKHKFVDATHAQQGRGSTSDGQAAVTQFKGAVVRSSQEMYVSVINGELAEATIRALAGCVTLPQ